jgi:hypothetical protein
MAIRLRDLDPVVELVLLPSGHEIGVYPADAGAIQLIRELEADPNDEDKARLCLRRLLPDATPDEILQLTPPMVKAVLLLATKQVAAVEEMLGESSGGRETASDLPLSPPETGTATSVNE